MDEKTNCRWLNKWNSPEPNHISASVAVSRPIVLLNPTWNKPAHRSYNCHTNDACPKCKTPRSGCAHCGHFSCNLSGTGGSWGGGGFDAPNLRCSWMAFTAIRSQYVLDEFQRRTKLCRRQAHNILSTRLRYFGHPSRMRFPPWLGSELPCCAIGPNAWHIVKQAGPGKCVSLASPKPISQLVIKDNNFKFQSWCKSKAGKESPGHRIP